MRASALQKSGERGGAKVGQQAAVHVKDYLLSKFVMLNADDKLH